MAARKTGSGRLLLNTGEWEALKDEVKEEVLADMEQPQPTRPELTSLPRPADSSESYIRAIAADVYTAKQRECFTSGPVGQLTNEVRELRREVKTVTAQVTDVQSDLQTARQVKELQERTLARRLTWLVGGFTMAGVLANVLNILWAIVHRGH